MSEFGDRFTISEEEENVRTDVFLSGIYEGFSRSFFQRLIKDGLVTLNGKNCKPGTMLKGDDELCVTFPEPKSLEVEPEAIPLSIIYEDSDVILVDKPKGMVVHPAAGHTTGTLVNALLYHCSDLSGINGVLRPGIVHRIDRDTTGILIVCKNDAAHVKIAEALRNHTITRRYLGIVTGNLPNDEGTIESFLGRDEKDRKKMAVTKSGKEAVTHYRVIRRYGDYTYCEFRLETGRTHQIRVHMSSIGHPLLGDTVYGSGKSPFKTEGQCLHAAVLGFVHPRTGEYMEFSSEPPAYFREILRKLDARSEK